MPGRKPKATPWVTQAEAADRLGVSRRTMIRWVQTGAIRRSDEGLISFDDARFFRDKRDEGLSPDEVAALRSTAPVETRPLRDVAGGAPDPGADGSVVPDLETAKARKEWALAELRELELAQKRGELVPVAEVAAHFRKQTAAAKDRIMLVAHRVAGQLAVETDEHEVRLLLEDELRKALREVAEAAAAYAQEQEQPGDDSQEPAA